MNDSPCLTADDRRFVYSVARRIVGDDDDAADVAQDAMLLAFRHADSFRGASRYRTWLYRIATTAALSHLRRRRRRRVDVTVRLGDEADQLHDLPAPDPTPEAAVALAEEARAARAEIATLDRKYGDVLRLRFEDDLSEADVARRLGITVATVKIRTYRGRHAVRAALQAV